MLIKLSGIVGSVFFGGIRSITEHAGAQGYWAIALGGVISLGVTLLSLLVGSRFPTQTPFIYARQIYGKIIGSLLMILLILTTLIAASLIMRNLGDFLITAILPNTPLSANIVVILFLVCVGTYIGLEALARFNELIAPIVLLAWVAVIGSSIPKFDIGWFRPFTQFSLGNLAATSIIAGMLLIDGMVELMFYPFVSDQKLLIKYLSIGVGIGTLFVLLVQAAVIGIYSPALAKTLTFPVLQIAKDTTLGIFLERIEALFLAIWILGTFTRVSAVFYGTSLGLAQTLGINNHRFFILPLAAAAFYIAFQSSNVPQSFNLDEIYNQISIFILVGILILLLIGSATWGQRKRSHEKH